MCLFCCSGCPRRPLRAVEKRTRCAHPRDPIEPAPDSLDENSGLLSNYEVLQVIQESLAALKEGTKVERQAQQNLHTVAFEANEYLQSGPSRRQTPEVVRAFLLAISKFPLTK